MTLDNMTGITKASCTADDTFCKSQLITCSRAKECNGVCPFEDALKHADQTQTMNEQHVIDHDRDWVIGCIEHDGFIHTHRGDKANQIILDALSAEAEWIPVSERFPSKENCPMDCLVTRKSNFIGNYVDMAVAEANGTWTHEDWKAISYGDVESGRKTGLISTRDDEIIAWKPLPKPYREESEVDE